MAKDNLNELANTISQLGTKLDELNELFDDLKKAIEVNKANFYNLKEELEEEKDKENFATLEEIVEQAEMADYGMKRWRTLETKQDLIAAIKKEVLNVV